MRPLHFFICTFILLNIIGCSTSKQSNQSTNAIFDKQYYIDLGKNITRLHQLSLGTFVAYADSKEELEQIWNVSEGDSVILYSIPLGNLQKDGHWILSYEFMTSLPNTPIYTSIKQIVQLSDRDSFQILYYEIPEKLSLTKLLQEDYVAENIIPSKLTLRDKKANFLRMNSAYFEGRSLVYEDPEAKCLRQNIYELTPDAYKVSVLFFDSNTGMPMDKKNRPNLMKRRIIPKKTLQKIAKKGAVKD